MRIFLDIDSRRLYSGPSKPLTKLEFKRRDNDAIELIFLRENVVQELPAGTTAKVGVKVDTEYASEFLALTTVTQSGTGTDTVYTGELNFNTAEMAAAFAAEPVTLAAMLEVEWLSGTALSSSKTLPVIVHNDVIRGDEGDPVTVPLFYTSVTSDLQATQAQAEAGTDSTTWMSPLRTAQAIAALAATDWDSVSGKPTEFAPEAHTHAVADVTGLQAALDEKAITVHTHSLDDLTDSGATTGQVATYDGTAWVPQDPSGGGDGFTSYYDLTDVPTTFPPQTHTHASSDITSGTLAIARIPTGTTSSTVALGNHTHSTYAATTHTHAIADVTGLQSALDAKQASGNYLTASAGFTAIEVVAALPATPDSSTLYIVTS